MTFAAAMVLCTTTAMAEAPVVQQVTADRGGGGWSISVTISHPETGWDHYADGWEVLAPDGTRLGLRVLAHPHASEQPFTRSLGSVTIPAGMAYISIRARDNVDGWFDDLFRVDLEN